MNIKKVFIKTAMTAIAIAIATVTTTFPNVAVLATPSLEQGGNETTTTGVTTSTEGQQSTIHIIKDSTNSYVLSGSSSSVGSFDTTYRLVGERNAIRSAENLIISTITDDFRTSPTIGYVMVGNTTTASAGAATLPNPFASPEQITERITNELRRIIGEAENNTVEGQDVEINCGFGMTLEDMQCHYSPLLQAGQG